MSKPRFWGGLFPGRHGFRNGFTLIELLIAVAIIAVLASLLIPTLSTAKLKAQGIQCLSNSRQLTLAWLMYADDHDGWVCPNGKSSKQGWVEGVMTFGYNWTDNTNTLYLVSPPYGKLGSYVKTPGVYRCPADRSTIRIDYKRYLRVRTLAMNQAVGSNADASVPSFNARWQIYRKLGDIVAPSPARLWVLIEQHTDSINDGQFLVDCENRNGGARWIDFPANFHNRSSNLSFADGHSETHKWLEEQTTQPNLYCGCLSHYADKGLFVSSPNSRDIAWIQDRTSARR